MKKDKILEINDFIRFDFIVDNGSEKIKNTETIETILGTNSIINGFDEKLIGKELDKNNEISFGFKLPENHSFFPGENVIFTLIILEHRKGSINHKVSITPEPKIKDKEHKLKKNIKKLEEEIYLLKAELKNNEKKFLLKIKELEHKSQTKILEFQELELKKTKDEIENVKKYATQKFVEQLIDPIINMEKAINFSNEKASAEVQAYSKGFTLLITQIFSALKENGVSEIAPKVGDAFDPKFHHVIEFVEDKEKKENTIITLVSKGFLLNDRVIKPALVNIIKK